VNRPAIKLLEWIALAVAVIGIGFKELHWPFTSLFLILGISVLSFMYFPLGYFVFGVPTRKEQNVPITIIGGLSLSIALLG
jgi:hypothetical protein